MELGQGRWGVEVSALCRKLQMSRQNYYAGRTRRRRRQIGGDLIEQLVWRERRLQPRLGTRKLLWLLQAELREGGVKIGRDRLFEHLRERDLLVPRKPARQPCTTRIYEPLPLFKNLIKDLVVSQANEVWVSDVTYVATQEGYLYLALITDQHSRKIVGYHVEETLAAQGPLCALEMALKDLPADRFLIHHSDRGCQYDSHLYVQRLQSRGLRISMTEVNHCGENALAERMNGILKQELGLDEFFTTKAQARTVINQAIAIYNSRRPHGALGMEFPEQVHARG